MNIFYLLADIILAYPVSMKKNKTRIRKPVMKWQSGDYQRTQTIKFELPLQFLMLCRLAGISPQQILTDFIDNLSGGSWKREGREKARQLLATYFIEHGYGNEMYSGDELTYMFSELDAMAMLFPKDGEPQMLDAYSLWREHHQEYWFNKWFNRQVLPKTGNHPYKGINFNTEII